MAAGDSRSTWNLESPPTSEADQSPPFLQQILRYNRHILNVMLIFITTKYTQRSVSRNRHRERAKRQSPGFNSAATKNTRQTLKLDPAKSRRDDPNTSMGFV